jgi:hypothetical protein
MYVIKGTKVSEQGNLTEGEGLVRRHDIQHKDTRDNDIQLKGLICDPQQNSF